MRLRNYLLLERLRRSCEKKPEVREAAERHFEKVRPYSVFQVTWSLIGMLNWLIGANPKPCMFWRSCQHFLPYSPELQPFLNLDGLSSHCFSFWEKPEDYNVFFFRQMSLSVNLLRRSSSSGSVRSSSRTPSSASSVGSRRMGSSSRSVHFLFFFLVVKSTFSLKWGSGNNHLHFTKISLSLFVFCRWPFQIFQCPIFLFTTFRSSADLGQSSSPLSVVELRLHSDNASTSSKDAWQGWKSKTSIYLWNITQKLCVQARIFDLWNILWLHSVRPFVILRKTNLKLCNYIGKPTWFILLIIIGGIPCILVLQVLVKFVWNLKSDFLYGVCYLRVRPKILHDARRMFFVMAAPSADASLSWRANEVL